MTHLKLQAGWCSEEATLVKSTFVKERHYQARNPVVPNRWVATPKWVAEEFLWGREQQPQ